MWQKGALLLLQNIFSDVQLHINVKTSVQTLDSQNAMQLHNSSWLDRDLWDDKCDAIAMRDKEVRLFLS